jgi:hypothetical protein
MPPSSVSLLSSAGSWTEQADTEVAMAISSSSIVCRFTRLKLQPRSSFKLVSACDSYTFPKQLTIDALTVACGSAYRPYRLSAA